MRTRYILILSVIVFSLVSFMAHAAEDPAGIDSQIKKRQVDLENYYKAKRDLEHFLDPDNHYIFFQRKGWVVPVAYPPEKAPDILSRYLFAQAVILQGEPDPLRIYLNMRRDLMELKADTIAIDNKLKQDLATIKKNITLVEADIQLLKEKRIQGPALLQQIVGKWKWFNGLIVEIADGEMFARDNNGKTVNSGSYQLLDSKKRKFKLHWDKGDWTDTLTLSKKGNHLSGKNQDKADVWADKIN